jgi:hypothetical protein
MKKSPEIKKGYNGYFPGKSVIEFHNKSFGVYSGHVDIRIHIKKGEYDGYEIIRREKGEKHGN